MIGCVTAKPLVGVVDMTSTSHISYIHTFHLVSDCFDRDYALTNSLDIFYFGVL